MQRRCGAVQEEIRDLLASDPGGQAASPGVHIREAVGGGVQLAGAQEREVGSQREMAAVLEQARAHYCLPPALLPFCPVRSLPPAAPVLRER
jgi:hypothetical protein